MLRVRAISEREAVLWAAFVEAYSATQTRGFVDMFLRGLFGRPK